MARTKNPRGNLEVIAAERARLQAELVRLDEAEKAAREVARDAGRKALNGALAKVKIGAMSRDDAKAIATAIATLGGSEAARKLAA